MKKIFLLGMVLLLLGLSACSLSASNAPFGLGSSPTVTQDEAKPAQPTEEPVGEETQDDIPTITPSEPEPTATMPLPTPTSTPTQVPPTPVPTEEEPTQTPTPTENAGPVPVGVAVNDLDGARIILIPEGAFTMGSDPESDPNFWGAEGPKHEVYLDEYWIYETEVTVGMYQTCYTSGFCPTAYLFTGTHSDLEDYRSDPDLPMVFVTWEQASFYCDWAADGLPTEAQWEKAARGTDDRLLPWGDLPFQEGFANYCGLECEDNTSEMATFDDGYPLTAPVGSFPAGASPFGVLDMAGNVWEWTADYFSQSYYAISPEVNPTGPVTGDRYVIRGGGFWNGVSGMRVVARLSLDAEAALNTVGFRCVVDGE